MSELINAKNNRKNFRRRLLVSASTLAIVASLAAPPEAKAGDTARPTIWIELGGQLEMIDGTGEPYAPAFIAAYPDSPVFRPISPSQADKSPRFAIGGESKVSYEPAGTNWVFSASVLYGRSNGNKEVVNQFTPSAKSIYGAGTQGLFKGLAHKAKFADTKALQNESHAIVDFQAGKDFGLGMFGKDSTSTVSLGVRFAQFASRAQVDMKARPDLVGKPIFKYYWHEYTAAGQSDRSFRGIGPSLSWKASAPVMGSHDDGEIALDWGVDAAVLFGRQKASVVHTTTARYHDGANYIGYPSYPPSKNLYNHTANIARARFVTVPNVGGFAGASFNYGIAKVSFGYRGEMFFGAVDGGWDTAHKENLSFHGPYAAISVGLGE